MRMTIWRIFGIAALLLALLAWTGCGDVFRPIANPIPGPTPDPKAYHYVIVASQNAPGYPGSGMQIDVSGDTDVGAVHAGATGVVQPGQGPVHAALLGPSAGRVYVANGLSDTVSTFTPASTLLPIGTVTTITLPPGSNPVFAHSTESSTMYAADYDASNVAVISAVSNAVTSLIPVGLNPAVLAETPNGRKLYSVNLGDGTVTSINTVDKSIAKTIGGLNGPVWAVASLDSSLLFVLSGSGSLFTINTFNDTVSSSVSVDSGANFLLLDHHFNRLYITSPANNSLTILDAGAANISSNSPPALIKRIVLAPGAPNPVMVTALADGSQAYVISNQVSPVSFTWEVTAIRASDNSLLNGGQPIASGTVDLTTILPPALATCAAARFRTSITSSVDNSRVYAAICDAGTTYTIRTSDDSCVDPATSTCVNVVSPVSAYPMISGVVNISDVTVSSPIATFAYSLASGSPPRVGMVMAITGMSDGGNNGTFQVTATGNGTFSVSNSAAVAATGQSGTGSGSQLPPQNPVWVVAGP